MSLLDLIRGKRKLGGFATAIPATVATEVRDSGRTVANVAVAMSPQGQTAHGVEVSSSANGFTSRWWRIQYADRAPVEVACCPVATYADILERHPDVVAAEPISRTLRQPSAPLTAREETAIRAWLALIEETDPATIAGVIRQCQQDADARDYFTKQAADLPAPMPGSASNPSRRASRDYSRLTEAKANE